MVWVQWNLGEFIFKHVFICKIFLYAMLIGMQAHCIARPQARTAKPKKWQEKALATVAPVQP